MAFSTICAIWIFGSNDLQNKDGKLDSDDYDDARVLDSGVNGNNERKSESDSLYRNLVKTTEVGMALVDESEMDKRIVEIQEMAREARQREKLEAKEKGSVDERNDDGDNDFIDKTGIEKEVDGRLIKLRKSLESSHEKLPYSFLRKEGEVGDIDKGNSAAKDAFGPLMFKKKYKFKSPSIDSRDKPKGFDGTEDHYAANGALINGNGTLQNDKTKDNRMSNGISIENGTLSNGISSENGILSNGINSDIGVSLLNNDERIELSNGDGLEVSATSIQDDDKEQERLEEPKPICEPRNDNKEQEPIEESKPISEPRDGYIEQEPLQESKPTSEPRNELANKSERAKPIGGKIESSAGISKEPKHDKRAVKAVKSRKSSTMEERKPRGFGKVSQSDAAISIKHDGVNRNGSVKVKNGGNEKPVSKFGDKKSSTQTDFWWSNLPYVLAVLMQRGGDGEGSEGLFTLRSTFQTKDGLSHTVAFEDRGDATNFCYLLESFFEDLGDFRTDIVPIPINELEEAVNSGMMKVVVVKKGRLQLYAGQPLTDVEMALRSLIDEQNNTF